MTEQELQAIEAVLSAAIDAAEADGVDDPVPCVLSIQDAITARDAVAEVRLLQAALRLSAEECAVQGSGTVDGWLETLREDARRALEGA